MTAGAVAEIARAKVNLALHVVGRRADGYHLLDSLVAFPPIGDRITVAPADGLSLAVTGPGADDLSSTAPADNLVMRAAERLRRLGPAGMPGAAITLEKHLPVAAGLGGGSADAAAAIRALAGLWGFAPDEGDLAALAEGLGADVPMCLASAPLRAGGIGERITPVPALPRLGIVLANPGVPVSTPAVFRALASRDNPPMPDLPGAWDAASLLGYLGACRNDLEAPAIAVAPAVAATLEALAALPGARLARMSGSGATCFALFDHPGAADAAGHALSAARPSWWVRAAPLA